MPGKRNFDQQLAALDYLRQRPRENCIEPLRKALTHRNNFIVGKAALLVRGFQLTQLMPELLGAFERFFENPVKSDPQCWAKDALARTLAAFEHQDAEVFLRGMRHIQLEPVWGGTSDSAGSLRATCALALVQCRGLADTRLLEHLLELLADKEKTVRATAIRAIEQVGTPAAALLLRQRAVLGSDEPEVLGACYGGILRIESVKAIPWISRFLASGDEAAAEAALAIAGTHCVEGFSVLGERFTATRDPWFRSVLLSAIALTRQDAAIEFLLELVRTESLHAEVAIEALLRAMPTSENMNRLEALVEGKPRMSQAFETHRAALK